MEDKKVGELWTQAQFVKTLPNLGMALTQWVEAAENLIRKLVEERAFSRYKGSRFDWSDEGRKKFMAKGLRDFDIDPATWKED